MGKICRALVLYVFASVLPAHGLELIDDLGQAVILDRAPERIVSLSPGNTELLFALGQGAHVVGVTEYCNYPPAAQVIDHVAGFNTLSVESVVAARPDLILAGRGNPAEGVETLRRMGLPVFALDIQSVEQLLVAVDRLGRLLDVGTQAAKLRGQLEVRVAAVRARVDSAESKPSVMWGYWGDPIFTAGGGTMIDDVFTLAGGVNVGRFAPGAWPQVSLETVVGWAPEVIVTTYHPGRTDSLSLASEIQRLRRTDGWKTIPAVRNGRVHYVEADLLNRPGPRLIDALEITAALLHPAAFR